MKTKSLIQFCNIFAVFSAFYGVSKFLGIFNLCYKLGKDDTNTLIWQVLVQGIEAWGIVLCCILFFTLASRAKKDRIFIVENEKFMLIFGCVIILLGIILYLLVSMLPINDHSTSAAMMFCLIGMIFAFFAFIFQIGRRMQEEQDLTI
jgi:hypothetical protein